jgi:hypothetical protein
MMLMINTPPSGLLLLPPAFGPSEGWRCRDGRLRCWCRCGGGGCITLPLLLALRRSVMHLSRYRSFAPSTGHRQSSAVPRTNTTNNNSSHEGPHHRRRLAFRRLLVWAKDSLRSDDAHSVFVRAVDRRQAGRLHHSTSHPCRRAGESFAFFLFCDALTCLGGAILYYRDDTVGPSGSLTNGRLGRGDERSGSVSALRVRPVPPLCHPRSGQGRDELLLRLPGRHRV